MSLEKDITAVRKLIEDGFAFKAASSGNIQARKEDVERPFENDPEYQYWKDLAKSIQNEFRNIDIDVGAESDGLFYIDGRDPNKIVKIKNEDGYVSQPYTIFQLQIHGDSGNEIFMISDPYDMSTSNLVNTFAAMTPKEIIISEVRELLQDPTNYDKFVTDSEDIKEA